MTCHFILSTFLLAGTLILESGGSDTPCVRKCYAEEKADNWPKLCLDREYKGIYQQMFLDNCELKCVKNKNDYKLAEDQIKCSTVFCKEGGHTHFCEAPEKDALKSTDECETAIAEGKVKYFSSMECKNELLSDDN